MGIKVREIIIPFFVDDKGVSRRKTPCVLMYVEFVKKKALISILIAKMFRGSTSGVEKEIFALFGVFFCFFY